MHKDKVRFIIKTGVIDSLSINIDTSINMANIKADIEGGILSVLGVDDIMTTKKPPIGNHKFKVGVSATFSIKIIALSIVLAIVNIARESEQIDNDTTMAVVYNGDDLHIDNVSALITLSLDGFSKYQ